jgi:hypothetical protein
MVKAIKGLVVIGLAIVIAFLLIAVYSFAGAESQPSTVPRQGTLVTTEQLQPAETPVGIVSATFRDTIDGSQLQGQ